MQEQRQPGGAAGARWKGATRTSSSASASCSYKENAGGERGEPPPPVSSVPQGCPHPRIATVAGRGPGAAFDTQWKALYDYGQWEQGDQTTRNNRFIACMGARIMATPDRSCSGSNPTTPPPVEAPRSIALIPKTPESSRAVLTDLTPAMATPAEGALAGSASGHAAVKI